MPDNTTAEGMTGNAVTLGDGFRVDSGVTILRVCGFHHDKGFDLNCGACATLNGYAASTQTPIPAQCELVSKPALDSLREAVKTSPLCEENAACPGGTVPCGFSFDDGGSDCGVVYLCTEHARQRDAAISRLISETGEVNG